MSSDILLPEQIVQQDGESPAIAVRISNRAAVRITLHITRIVERESLELSILGSTDGEKWSGQPLLRFTPKFYCGAYHLRLDFSEYGDVAYLKLKWRLNRWGHGETGPLFGLSVTSTAAVPAARSASA